MFALPGQTAADVVADLERAAELGADQLTMYPLFTFPYTAVGEYLHLHGRRHARTWRRDTSTTARSRRGRRAAASSASPCGASAAATQPRYSSVTRDGYLGIGPGAGSHLPDGFVLNTFDLDGVGGAPSRAASLPIALRMPFAGEMAGWWWLYWRFYDTRIPLRSSSAELGGDAAKARRWLRGDRGLPASPAAHDGALVLTDAGAFWLHLAQNHFALAYVNALWTAGRRRALAGCGRGSDALLRAARPGHPRERHPSGLRLRRVFLDKVR